MDEKTEATDSKLEAAGRRERLYRQLMEEARGHYDLDDETVLAKWLGNHEYH